MPRRRTRPANAFTTNEKTSGGQKQRRRRRRGLAFTKPEVGSPRNPAALTKTQSANVIDCFRKRGPVSGDCDCHVTHDQPDFSTSPIGFVQMDFGLTSHETRTSTKRSCSAKMLHRCGPFLIVSVGTLTTIARKMKRGRNPRPRRPNRTPYGEPFAIGPLSIREGESRRSAAGRCELTLPSRNKQESPKVAGSPKGDSLGETALLTGDHTQRPRRRHHR